MRHFRGDSAGGMRRAYAIIAGAGLFAASLSAGLTIADWLPSGHDGSSAMTQGAIAVASAQVRTTEVSLAAGPRHQAARAAVVHANAHGTSNRRAGGLLAHVL